MLLLLCLIHTFTWNSKLWPCLLSSYWTIIVLCFSRNCLDTGSIIEWVLENVQRYCKYSRIMTFFLLLGIIIEWLLEKFQRYWKFSRIMSFFLLFVCSLIFGIKWWTQLFSIFLLFCFFFSFHLTLYGDYSGRYWIV